MLSPGCCWKPGGGPVVHSVFALFGQLRNPECSEITVLKDFLEGTLTNLHEP